MEFSPEQLQEVQFIVQQLQLVLGQDNDARKAAEEHLKKIKEGEPDKYACYLTRVLMEPEAPSEIKALAAVILRRGIGSFIGETKKTLWETLGQQARDYLKANLLLVLQTAATKDLVHKLSNLLVEVAGNMYEDESN
mmetsp:Transcript_1961/g.2901  ORF Transcript_1961/g.2901 Transcript_1961/m.2901 type:complete len:137 (+) Transcript_1961:25-435(+)